MRKGVGQSASGARARHHRQSADGVDFLPAPGRRAELLAELDRHPWTQRFRLRSQPLARRVSGRVAARRRLARRANTSLLLADFTIAAGIQAQTLANFYLALVRNTFAANGADVLHGSRAQESDLDIVPVMSKMDLIYADKEAVIQQMCVGENSELMRVLIAVLDRILHFACNLWLIDLQGVCVWCQNRRDHWHFVENRRAQQGSN